MELNNYSREPYRSLWFLFFALQVTIVPLLPYSAKLAVLLFSTAGILALSPTINKSLFSFLRPLLLISGIGVVLGLGNSLNDPYGFFRDFYYFLQPIF